VAASSVAVAVVLTGTKLVVGVATGSLGILSEAAHSGLDMLAAIMTWIAVHVSGKPSDRDHPYGHQKVENLSALFETLLLVVTCVWILYEATRRLLHHSAHVEVNAWSFAVIFGSIVLDYSRSRALYRVAKKTNSQALEADALHFASDIASSLVVLAGLIFTKLGYAWADPLAAGAVAVLVCVICFRLGVRAINSLVDRVNPEQVKLVREAAAGVPGVHGVWGVRVREAGGRHFADLSVGLRPDLALEEAHRATELVEAAVAGVLRNADVVVHAEPASKALQASTSIESPEDERAPQASSLAEQPSPWTAAAGPALAPTGAAQALLSPHIRLGRPVDCPRLAPLRGETSELPALPKPHAPQSTDRG
ncbi:MAG TPA: cation diffusion facilitator family transporter, partial [Armatimonadota bacterium]